MIDHNNDNLSINAELIVLSSSGGTSDYYAVLDAIVVVPSVCVGVGRPRRVSRQEEGSNSTFWREEKGVRNGGKNRFVQRPTMTMTAAADRMHA